MRFVIAVVGKPRDATLARAIGEYETRAARYWPLVVQEVRKEPGRSVAEDLVREREGKRLASTIPDGAKVIACDERGEAMTSQAFATLLQQLREHARDVAFVIGGACGLSASLRGRAVTKLALAAWTLPHELARLVLAEQLYRAGSIVRGEPYHK